MGGFYITNAKETKLKVGSTFKKGDILAYNKNYFSDNEGNPDYTVGTLAKVAVYSGYYIYEDSILVSETLTEKMASDVTMEKHLVLGPNTNIISCLDPGSPVRVGEGVITIEDSYDEKEANILLSKIGDKYKQDVLEQGRNTVYSKYTGFIADIEIYYTCEFEELSPSLQKLVKRINKVHEERAKVLKQHFDSTADLSIDMKPTGKVEPSSNGKIKGVEVGDGVLIRIFTTYRDYLGVGDKLSFYSALKGIIQQVVPEDMSSYSEMYPNEPIEAVLAPGSIQARMTGSAMLNLFSNKVLIELKRDLKEMYGMKRY